MRTLIYAGEFLNRETLSYNTSTYIIKIWYPSINCLIPAGKGKKYFVYWLFHYLNIFKTRDYSALLVYDKDYLVASMLVVPAHFKWPFMAKDDLQFTYVLTKPAYQGKGIGEMMLRKAIQEFKRENRKFWYVTDTNNHASIKLCNKVGFKLWAYGVTIRLLKVMKANIKN